MNYYRRIMLIQRHSYLKIRIRANFWSKSNQGWFIDLNLRMVKKSLNQRKDMNAALISVQSPLPGKIVYSCIRKQSIFTQIYTSVPLKNAGKYLQREGISTFIFALILEIGHINVKSAKKHFHHRATARITKEGI